MKNKKLVLILAIFVIVLVGFSMMIFQAESAMGTSMGISKMIESRTWESLDNENYFHEWFKMYETEDLTGEILEKRNGKMIVEKLIGTVINENMDGELWIDSEFNYISYSCVNGAEVGDTILTYCIYNPDSNYIDDILWRFDFIV